MMSRIDQISNAINDCLSQDFSVNGTQSIHDALKSINPTVRDFLTLANKEKTLEGPIAMCGTQCEGDCNTCNVYSGLLDEHFENKQVTPILLCGECGYDEATMYNDYNEKGDVCAACFWDLRENERRETGMLRMQEELKKLNEETTCYTCGSECISFEVDGSVHWLCENCYYGNEPAEIGYCGFPCDGYCQTCGGGYDANGEI